MRACLLFYRRCPHPLDESTREPIYQQIWLVPYTAFSNLGPATLRPGWTQRPFSSLHLVTWLLHKLPWIQPPRKWFQPAFLGMIQLRWIFILFCTTCSYALYSTSKSLHRSSEILICELDQYLIKLKLKKIFDSFWSCGIRSANHRYSCHAKSEIICITDKWG